MTSKRILVLGGGQYARPFTDHGVVEMMNPKSFDTSELCNYNLVVFTGGADVSPRMYGERWNHQNTHWDWERDVAEKYIFDLCVKHKIPQVGICRGAQFLCVANHGTLVQDVDNHAVSGTHRMNCVHPKPSLQVIPVTSTHHQMMFPMGTFTILGYAPGLSSHYEDGTERNFKPEFPKDMYGDLMEPEVVWYPINRSLAVQYHPEYMADDTKGWKYFQFLLEEYVL